MQRQSKPRAWMTTGLLAAAIACTSTGARADDIVEQAEDDTWIALSGTVVSAGDHSFRLDYGDGVVTVEMDDFAVFPDARALLENDKVVVQGLVDDDLFEAKTIEASSVYVESLGTYFYSKAADEEDFTWMSTAPIVVGTTEVTGTVTAVDGREFSISTGLGIIRVETDEMVFNPMDDQGYLRIDVGDRVKVEGTIDHELFDGHQLTADVITELHR